MFDLIVCTVLYGNVSVNSLV